MLIYLTISFFLFLLIGSNANQNENLNPTTTLGSPTNRNAPSISPTNTSPVVVGCEETQIQQQTVASNIAVPVGSIAAENNIIPDNNEVCLTPPQRNSTNSNDFQQQQSTPKSNAAQTHGQTPSIATTSTTLDSHGFSPDHLNNNRERISLANEESPLPHTFNNIESSTLNESQLVIAGDNSIETGVGGGGIIGGGGGSGGGGGIIVTNNLSTNITLQHNQQVVSNYQSITSSSGSTLTSGIQNGSNRNYNPIMIPQRQSLLPWGTNSRSSIINVIPYTAATANINTNQLDYHESNNSLRPGEIVMRNLFTDFTLQAEKKIELVMLESVDKPLSKLLQRGEDQQFDQLLSALGSVAEHCLPSLLHTLLAWHRRQLSDAEIKNDLKRMEKSTVNLTKPLNSQDIEFQLQRREAAVEFIFCLALIEILKQLPFHPGHEDLVRNIENLAFKHFKYKEGLQNNPNAHNIHMIADLYAEVIGVLAQSRFSSVRKRFMSELKELRAKEPSPHTTQSIISLLMGMKFFRVKVS